MENQNNTTYTAYLKNPVLNSIVQEPPTANEIFYMLLSTNPSKACGYDNICIFLRIGEFVLAPILGVHFGKALELRYFSPYL